jgi:hypothetical protein
MTRFIRRFAAFAALAALALSQVAVAANACMQAAEQRSAASQSAPSHDCCDDGGMCMRYCAYDASTVDTQAVVPVAAPCPAPTLRVEPVVWQEPAARAPQGPERIHEPPPLDRFGVLRI